MTVEQTPERIVLLVEDNDADAELTREFLTSHRGARYALHRVSCFADAMAMLRSIKVDVVLLDLFLPDFVATAGVTEMRALIGDVPILMLTGLGDEDVALECIQAGAHDFLNKNQYGTANLGHAIEGSLARQRAGEHRMVREHLASDRRLAGEGVLASLNTGPVPENMPLRDRLPDMFDAFVAQYRTLLRAYVEDFDQGKAATADEMQQLVQAIAASGGGARDLIDVHTRLVDRIPQNASADQYRPLVVEGRIFALEMMGLLVDCYRLGHDAGSPKMNA